MGLVYICERCKGEMRPYKDLDKQPCRACLVAEIKQLQQALRGAAEMADYEEDRTLIHNHCIQAAQESD